MTEFISVHLCFDEKNNCDTHVLFISNVLSKYFKRIYIGGCTLKNEDFVYLMKKEKFVHKLRVIDEKKGTKCKGR